MQWLLRNPFLIFFLFREVNCIILCYVIKIYKSHIRSSDNYINENNRRLWITIKLKGDIMRESTYLFKRNIPRKLANKDLIMSSYQIIMIFHTIHRLIPDSNPQSNTICLHTQPSMSWVAAEGHRISETVPHTRSCANSSSHHRETQGTGKWLYCSFVDFLQGFPYDTKDPGWFEYPCHLRQLL